MGLGFLQHTKRFNERLYYL